MRFLRRQCAANITHAATALQFPHALGRAGSRLFGAGVTEPLAQSGELLHEGDFDGAERLYRRSLELEPDCGPAYNNLAYIAEGRGDVAAMRVHIEKSLEIDPDNLLARCHMAHLHLREDQVEEAEKLVGSLIDRQRFAPFELKTYQTTQVPAELRQRLRH